MNIDMQSIAEKCSSSQALDSSELPLLLPYVESFLDKDWLDTKLAEYKAWAANNSNPFLQHSFLHRPIGFNMLVAAIWAMDYWKREHETDVSFKPRMGAIRLMNIACSLAILEFYAEGWLNTAARKYLEQRLQSTEDLWGLIHELNTFAYFIRKGKKVEPHFLKRASRIEMIVDWHGAIIPVECKNLRPGTGRSISQDVFITLAGYIAIDMRKANKSLMVKIRTTGKMPTQDIDFLRLQVQKYAGTTIAPVLVKHKERIYSIMGQQLPNKGTESLLEEYLPGSYLRMIIAEPETRGGKNKPVAVVGIEANPIEKPFSSLRSAIMKGVNQLPDDRPGILAVYYTDPVEDFNSFCPGPLTMQEYISRLLTPFSHIGMVLMSSEPNYLGPPDSKAGKTYMFYRKPWAFPEDFLEDDGSCIEPLPSTE